MSATDYAIRVQGLGKKYNISHNGQRESYTSLRDAIMRGPMGLFNRSGRSTREEFWALRDLTFDVARGDAIGVIGRNGAGKSTFLKVLSRITEPSTGEIRVAGRVSSLLEVGTGFHPELTGRENIFLNGTILGMKRAEIKQRFDEIVTFAGVERFLDTPVKRYSSGMYTRLAFAVAAHLDSEILVVDEVLAVGDAEFQRKCLGRMHDIAGEGRTVLFVSHNMAAVKSLTTKCVVLDAGRVVFSGPTEEAIAVYQAAGSVAPAGAVFKGRGQHTRLVSARLVGSAGQAIKIYDPNDPLVLEVEFETDGSPRLSLDVILTDAQCLRLGMFSLSHFADQALPRESGRYTMRVSLGQLQLAAGGYFLDLYTAVINNNWDHAIVQALEFEVNWSNPAGGAYNFQQSSGFGSLALPPVGEVAIERIDDVQPVVAA
jgi:lipopolysaccharide transport system ATP-binding protein